MEEKIKDLLDYNHQMNHKLIQLFIENEAKTDARTTSLLSHILNAQQVWNSRILGETPFGVWQINPTNKLEEINQSVYQKSLEIVQNISLDNIIHYKNSQGNSFTNSVCDILLHIVNHATYHRGQIATAFRIQGIQPLATDYIFHRREELL